MASLSSTEPKSESVTGRCCIITVRHRQVNNEHRSDQGKATINSKQQQQQQQQQQQKNNPALYNYGMKLDTVPLYRLTFVPVLWPCKSSDHMGTGKVYTNLNRISTHYPIKFKFCMV